MDAPPSDGVEKAPHEDHDAHLRGPKNLLLDLKDVRFEGVASSASAAYRQGLTEIEENSRLELSNITQAPTPTVNNGVIVCLDQDSTWIVTGTCYLTRLTLAPGAILKGVTGKRLTMTVNGLSTPIVPRDHIGAIVLSLV